MGGVNSCKRDETRFVFRPFQVFVVYTGYWNNEYSSGPSVRQVSADIETPYLGAFVCKPDKHLIVHGYPYEKCMPKIVWQGDEPPGSGLPTDPPYTGLPYKGNITVMFTTGSRSHWVKSSFKNKQTTQCDSNQYFFSSAVLKHPPPSITLQRVRSTGPYAHAYQQPFHR